MTIIKINERGANARVLNGEAGMTFVVDKFTSATGGNVAHVRDYRYTDRANGQEFQIWSLAGNEYEIVVDVDAVNYPDDINIHWTNKAKYNRHQVALDIQDAGNLRALAREFVKVVDSTMDENKSTIDTWADPAVRLFVNKFESLCRSDANFSEAYAACKQKAGVQ